MAQTTFTDDFSGSGNLAGSAVGSSALLWKSVAGALSRSSGVVAGAAGSICSAPVAWPNVTITVTGTVGTDLIAYGRVQDANNWWRARVTSAQVITGTFTSFSAWSDWSAWGNWSTPQNFPTSGSGLPDTQDYYSGYVTTSIDGNGPTRDDQWPFGPSDARSRHRTRTAVTTHNTATMYTLLLEKCIAGTVTTVATSAQSTTMPTSLALTLSDDALSAVAGPLSVSATDAALDGITDQGVGPGPADWSCVLLNVDTPPAITSPATGSEVDITDVVIEIKSGFPVSDPQTAADGQWRKTGDTDWTAATDVFGTGSTWAFDTTGLTSGDQVEAQVRATDSNGNTTPWSPSVFFTVRAQPTDPAFVSPTAGSTVVVADIAVVDFDTDSVASTARQARRVADDGSGNPDTNTVYQASLTITGPDGDGHYTVSGDGSVHPTGAEHVQVRRQTAAGGSLWSSWADLLVDMELAVPYPPGVQVTPLAADAAIRFDVTTTAADVDHTDVDHVDFYRDGVRVASVGVTNNAATWTDQVPGTASDYRIDAVAANTAITSWGVES